MPRVLTVSDDGPGIPEDAQEAVFARFFRLGGAVASGSGLGLAIARELAELMHGQHRAASRPGSYALHARAPAGRGGASGRARRRRKGMKSQPPKLLHPGCVRPALVVALCALAASAGAGGAIFAVESGGWDGGGAQTVLVREPLVRSSIPSTVVVSKPVLARGFAPRAIYATRIPGVVTVFSYFGAKAAARRSRRAPGFVVDARARSSPPRT